MSTLLLVDFDEKNCAAVLIAILSSRYFYRIELNSLAAADMPPLT